jgi:hypothetical protein
LKLLPEIKRPNIGGLQNCIFDIFSTLAKP